MKTIMITLMVVLLLASSAFASTCHVTLPSDCVKINDSEFSTGGGDKAMWIIEVGCFTSSGAYKKYIATKVSASGFFGFGRWTTPDLITFSQSNISVADLSCK